MTPIRLFSCLRRSLDGRASKVRFKIDDCQTVCLLFFALRRNVRVLAAEDVGVLLQLGGLGSRVLRLGQKRVVAALLLGIGSQNEVLSLG